jgi:4-carboxymuconolactone decarboxylase
MSESRSYQDGTEVRRKLVGDSTADQLDKDIYADPIMKKFSDYARETLFGQLWTRAGLDLKTRALICVISDTCQAQWGVLPTHVRMARNQGWTEDELVEALLHVSGYIGLPPVREALLHASAVFAEMRAEPQRD